MVSNHLVYPIICQMEFHCLMKSLPRNIFSQGLLLTAVLSIAAVGVVTASVTSDQSAAAQEMTTNTTTNATESSANNTTGTTTAASDSLAGIIASLQIHDALAPEWVTAGYWELESDGPLFGGNNQSEPTVTRFDAIVEMTNVSDGSGMHEHTFSNFRQSDIVFASGNSTTINGTMTVTTEDGPTEDVPAYMTLQNNLIAIFVNPNAVDNHFGPTPIYGMILSSDKLQEISNRLSGTDMGTGTAGQQNTTSTTSVGNATGQ